MFSMHVLVNTLLAIACATPPAGAQITQADYSARRDALMATVDSGVLILAGAREPTGHYPSFQQRPPFRYLTGFLEPDAALVMVKRGGHTAGTLFIQPPDARREFYNGTRVTPDEVTHETGLAARRNNELEPVVDSLIGTGLPLFAVSDAQSEEFVSDDSLSYGSALIRRLKTAHPGLDVHDATPAEEALRAKKSAAEIAIMQKAADISVLGHRAVLQAVHPGENEYEIQALMEYTFRKNGAERPSYASIVGSGPNSTTLHYDRDDRVMHAGEVILMDVAAQYQGYAADVTRTLPVSGKFTANQRAIYQIVRDAQGAGERQVRPGVRASQEVDSIRTVIAAGLQRLGLIDSARATFDPPPGFCGRAPTCPQAALFMPHGPGHGLGLDVHDPAQWYGPPFQFGIGDALTIEPGIYIRPSIIDALPDTPANRAYVSRIRPLLERYANIGVRIEDDYVVTSTGVQRLTAGAPREIGEIESLMKR